MVDIPPLVIETPRLVLRAGRRSDAASLFAEYTGTTEASRYLQRSAHASQMHTEAVVDALGKTNWKSSSRFAWSIVHRQEKRAVGLFLIFIAGQKAEIHYGLGPAFWGQGLATEAGMAVMDWVIHQSSISEVSTSCAAEHAASLRVLEKIGLRRGLLRRSELLLPSAAKRVDAWLYSWKRSRPLDRSSRSPHGSSL